MSRQGWAVVDDSRTLVFDENCWIAQRAHPENLDLYFFGYGHDYPGCLRDFSRAGGRGAADAALGAGQLVVALLGTTRQQEYLELMAEFKERGMPLSVCVIDMDWHITRTGNACSRLDRLHLEPGAVPRPGGLPGGAARRRGCKATLNLHPAEGVHPHEAGLPRDGPPPGDRPGDPAAGALRHRRSGLCPGLFRGAAPPAGGAGRRFLVDRLAAGRRAPRWPGSTRCTGSTTCTFTTWRATGSERPFIFSRWGGLGNHRYPIGFSGDTVISWASLAFQPVFHRHRRQRGLRLVEPRHRRAHARHPRRRAVRPLGAVRRLQPDPAPALHQEPLTTSAARGVTTPRCTASPAPRCACAGR